MINLFLRCLQQAKSKVIKMPCIVKTNHEINKQEKHSKSADLRHLGQILILKYDAASKEISWFVILV